MSSSDKPAATIVAARGLTKSFGGGLLSSHEVHAVRHVTLELRRRHTFGLVGESGCGKSTLARMLAGLDAPTAGGIELDGKHVTPALRNSRDYFRHVQMVFQDPFGALNPRRSIRQILEAPLLALTDLSRDERLQRMEHLLERVKLPRDMLKRYPHQLSGGQAQRIGVARALAPDPRVLILDEAVASLDVSIQADVLALLRELRDELGLAYLFISHDLAVVEQVADEVAVMYLGSLVETGPARALLTDPRHPYTHCLVSAVIEPMQEVRRIPLRGEPPLAGEPPPGCAFHPRCYRAEAICSRETPPLEPLQSLSERNPRCSACHFALDCAPEQHARPERG